MSREPHASALLPNVPLNDVEELLGRLLTIHYGGNERTLLKVSGEVSRFFRFARAHGVNDVGGLTPSLIVDFCWRASRDRGELRDVSARTAANRQSFLRATFGLLRAAGVAVDADLFGAPIARGAAVRVRPLSDLELARVRLAATDAMNRRRDVLLVGLSEAGADASEIGSLRIDDLDLRTGLFQVAGASSRLASLPHWAMSPVTDYVARLRRRGPDLVAVKPELSPERAAHSVTVGLMQVLNRALPKRPPEVTAGSIRLGAARWVLDEHGLEAAARFLGNRSLDATAAALEYRWTD